MIATRPTFCTNAVCVKELNTGATAEESMSARSPSAMRAESMRDPVTSDRARMSAVVSAMFTRITMHMATIAAMWNVGGPKWNGEGSANHGPCPTCEKSAMPTAHATTVPTTIATRMASRDSTAPPNLDSSSTASSVTPARAMFASEPYPGAFSSPPMDHDAATGTRVMPIVVMIDPVTTGGKNRSTRAKNGAIRNPNTEATMMEPITDGMPPPVASTDSMVAIPVKDTPCTSGSWQPIRGSPHACRNVANPPTNRAAATSRAVVAASYPAAPATTSGTAMSPPYMVRMCCTA